MSVVDCNLFGGFCVFRNVVLFSNIIKSRASWLMPHRSVPSMLTSLWWYGLVIWPRASQSITKLLNNCTQMMENRNVLGTQRCKNELQWQWSSQYVKKGALQCISPPQGPLAAKWWTVKGENGFRNGGITQVFAGPLRRM